jgi:hypothetical protein
MKKFKLNSDQIIAGSRCKHCHFNVVVENEYTSGNSLPDISFYCTCPTSEHVEHYRESVYEAEQHWKEQQELLDGFMSVEPKHVVDARVEAQVNEVLKKSGYTVEELRGIFKLDK